MRPIRLSMLALGLSLWATNILVAQSPDGAISPRLLLELRKAAPSSATEQALRNAIALQGMKDFFVNPLGLTS